MARPRKPRAEVVVEDTPVAVEPANRTYGPYSITKPHDHYVVKLGGSVVFASRSEDEVNKYIDRLTVK